MSTPQLPIIFSDVHTLLIQRVVKENTTSTFGGVQVSDNFAPVPRKLFLEPDSCTRCVINIGESGTLKCVCRHVYL